jgi:hypothetical protein
MPAGERARKRRAAQAAFLRGASRTPLVCGHQDNASAGVPLSFIYCRGRVDKKRFVDETASTAPLGLLRGLIFWVGKTRVRKPRRENDFPLRHCPIGNAQLPFPGRSAAQARLRASLTRYGLSEAPHLQTRDRRKLGVVADPGSAARHFTPHRIRGT